MAETGQRRPASTGGAAPPDHLDSGTGHATPWHLLQGLQDRHRYLRLLEPLPERADAAQTPDEDADPQPSEAGPDPTGADPTDRAENPDEPILPPDALDLDAPLPRAGHHLLRSPAAMTRTATNFPHPREVADYLAHSADLTVRGGITAAVASSLAACGLAEHYVFRRVGGSSAGAVTAAAVAAAELGRTAPDTRPPQAPQGPPTADRTADRPTTVQPGFAGLAETLGWLAGQDRAGDRAGDRAETYRLARMFQPARSTRDVYRALVALTRLPARNGFRARATPVLVGLLSGVGRRARLVVSILLLGAVLAWVGSTIAMIRSGTIPLPLILLVSVAVSATLVLAVLAATVIGAMVTLRSVLGERAELEHFGLVPGIRLPDMDFTEPTGPAARSGRGSRLDRWTGVPAADGVPPLATWVADRLDDLAGIPAATAGGSPAPGDEPPSPDWSEGTRPALTFGELWLGRLGPPTAEELSLLRRAADNPELRCIDLALATSNISQGRPYTLPFGTAERAEREGGSRFLFCRSCLTAVLPVRVVAQMILASPAQARESACPRHEGELLREVPEPWDFPVAAAVRMSMSLPGLLRAVPLVTLDVESHGPLQDAYGGVVAPPPPPPTVFVPRVQWFCDGGLTAGMSVDHFDTWLPRWPTFALAVEPLRGRTTESPGTGDRLAEWVTVPEQDAAKRAWPWRRVSGPAGFLGALAGAVASWRDTMQSAAPGHRGRMAVVRYTAEESLGPLFTTQSTLLQLGLRGYQAGLALRDRFTGGDGDATGQTQTDRYRWIRMRMALRQYRRTSLAISARLPLYSDLAASYQVPEALTHWFTPPIPPGSVDPAWPDAAAAVTHLRALSAGGVLDWDTDYGAPPTDPDARFGPVG